MQPLVASPYWLNWLYFFSRPTTLYDFIMFALHHTVIFLWRHAVIFFCGAIKLYFCGIMQLYLCGIIQLYFCGTMELYFFGAIQLYFFGAIVIFLWRHADLCGSVGGFFSNLIGGLLKVEWRISCQQSFGLGLYFDLWL